VAAKLDRLARSLRDAKDIIDELTVTGVELSIGGSVHDPTDPVGRLLFTVLAMVAEFESDWTCTALAHIPRVSSLSCSTSPAPPCTAPSNDNPSTAETHSPTPVAEPSNSATGQTNRGTGSSHSDDRAVSQGNGGFKP
jgi:hypothetical protein